jgi:hypothetical protein
MFLMSSFALILIILLFTVIYFLFVFLCTSFRLFTQYFSRLTLIALLLLLLLYYCSTIYFTYSNSL